MKNNSTDILMAVTLAPVIPLACIPFFGRFLAAAYWITWYAGFVLIASTMAAQPHAGKPGSRIYGSETQRFDCYYSDIVREGKKIGLRLETEDESAREYFWLYHFVDKRHPTASAKAVAEAKAFWESKG